VTFSPDPDTSRNIFRLVRLGPNIQPSCAAVVAAQEIIFP
jgi:hypothetical protein